MLAHRSESVVQADGSLIVKNVPFHTGEIVEVILLPRVIPANYNDSYPLRGTKVEYIAPFENAVEEGWEAAQ
ncbi:MAG: hypothetical protein WCJ56_12005 [bacterium]